MKTARRGTIPQERRPHAHRLLALATTAALALVLVGSQATLVAAEEDPANPAAETLPVEETTAPVEDPVAEEEEPVDEHPAEAAPVEEETAAEESTEVGVEEPEPTSDASEGTAETDQTGTASRLSSASVNGNNGDNVCPTMDGKWQVTQGAWDGSAAPGITGISASGDQSITFTVASGYQLTSICVETGNGVNQGDWSASPSLPVTGPASVTVTSTGGQGAGLSHITFDTETVPTPQDSYVLSVTKLWDPVDTTASSTPPGDLPAGFQLGVGGQGQNSGTLTSYVQGSLSCAGNLVVAHGETVAISENAAGWTGPTQATASCQKTQNQTGGTDTSCSISVTNVEDTDPQDTHRLTVTKQWLPAGGQATMAKPADLPSGFQLELSGQELNTGRLTCSYDQGSLSCTGDLVVADGETVGVTENAEGWDGPSQAMASCQSSENQSGGSDSCCSIGLTNVEREVLGSTTDPLAPVTSADRPGDPENPGDPVSPGPSVPTGESLAFTGFRPDPLRDRSADPSPGGVVPPHRGPPEDRTGY